MIYRCQHRCSADDYWAPFKLALQPSRPVRLREAALAALQKLMAHNLLRGARPITTSQSGQTAQSAQQASDADPLADLSIAAATEPINLPLFGRRFSISSLFLPDSLDPATRTSWSLTQATQSSDPSSQQSRPSAANPDHGHLLLQTPMLIDEIIAVVVNSINNQQANAAEESLQVHVLQVLLTAVTSTECQVHERSLIRVIQTCFAIYASAGKNTANEVTAKAALTQMINLIFSRMERYADVLAKTLDSGASASHLARATSTSQTQLQFQQQSSQTQTQSNEQSNEQNSSHLGISLTRSDPVPLEASSDEAVDSVFVSSAPVVSLESDVSSPDRTPARSLVTDPTLSAIVGSDNNPYNPSVSFFNELLRKDVYLVLRFLCFMSMHSDAQNQSVFNPATFASPNTVPHDELSPISIKSRIIAMELIVSVMNNAGPVLRSDDLYIRLVRQSLCLSISRNALNTNTTLFELSWSIFLLVVRHYREHAKVEIEVLLSTVYLHILEMGNASFKQKSAVLHGLLKICENPQTLVDLYVNYDCDIAMSSVFELILNACSKISQGRSESSAKPAAAGSFSMALSAVGLDSKNELLRDQDRRLKLQSLSALVAIVQSLSVWSQDSQSLKPQIAAVAPDQDQQPSESSASNGIEPTNMHVAPSAEASPARLLSSSPAAVAATARPYKSAQHDTDVDSAKTFLDALDPSNQTNPVVIANRNPLHAVSMDQATEAIPLSSVPSTETNHQDIEQAANRKQLLRRAIRLFNQKPNKGIQFLIENNFVSDQPEAIADFLRSTTELSKPAIGEYLGEHMPINVQVMHAFIDSVDFTNMDFVAALRSFLQLFRLPKEAQKIDRIMEKFADRYCEGNPDIFARADTAYMLAFSVIMLNTDQHSSQIKNRMDKPAFVKNNRGINADGDLPEDYLGAIFDEISSNEIIMEEEHAGGKLAQIAMGWGAGGLNDRQRMDLYKKEISVIQKKSQMLMKAGTSNRVVAPFRTAVGRELARPMFAMSSWALMATFSLLFESVVDDTVADEVDFTSRLSTLANPKFSDLCLRGFACAIRTASAFKMETERDAFVSSLAKLTSLGNFFQMKPKNVKAIRTLIDLALNLGEVMESSWLQIIKTISQLERMQMIVVHGSTPVSEPGMASLAGSRDSRGSDAIRTAPDRSSMASNELSIASHNPGRSDLSSKRVSAALESLVADFQSQTSLIVIDRIFTRTVNLSATAIIYFFRALCQVSLEEVGIDANGMFVTSPTPGPPRMYLLQKIVEVAYYNMLRIRFEWTQIWHILQQHFNTVACHPSQLVATFAVDSLRQLGMKFLEREELGHFSSQHEFLKSFEWIMKHNQSPTIRELILNSLSQMITARARSIRSGWKSIFAVLVKASKTDARMAMLAFSIVQMIFRSYFDDVVLIGGFVDLVSCLAEFALLKGQGPAHDELVMGSIQLLQSCTKSLVERAKDEAMGVHAQPSKPRAKRPAASSATSTQPAGLATSSPLHPPRINNLPQQAYLMPNGCVSEEHFYLSWF
eukprot:jgi/Hompol1/4139/HPOL_003490-RA